MAAKKKKRVKKKYAADDSFLIISLEKKKKIIGLLMIVFAFLILLSILSYSGKDRAVLSYDFSDFKKIFESAPDKFSNGGGINNWLGIFGAYMSNFLINSTIGYFSIAFPAILFIWGYKIFKNIDSRIAVYLSNWIIIIAVILSSLFGSIKFGWNYLTEFPELSGKVGGFFGAAIAMFLGSFGSVVFLITLFLVSLSAAFDVKFTLLVKLFEFFKALIKNQKEDALPVDAPLSESPRKSSAPKRNLKMPKFLDDKPERSDSEREDTPRTRIRIIKNDDDELIIGQPEEPEFRRNKKSPEKKKKTADKKKLDKTESGKENIRDVPPQEKPDAEIEDRLPEQWNEKIKYASPKIDLLIKPTEEDIKIPEQELKHNAELLKEKLALFDIQINDISVTPGPVVTLYEIVPAPGVKISRIVNLEHDIALALAARGIRIIAPIPGKSAIGVEIPNSKPSLVGAFSVIQKLKKSGAALPLALGKTINGEIYITDLAEMPHLLIAGSTGSGKSVGINMFITSLLYAKHPSDVKFVIIDPKKIELSFYRKLRKHFLAVCPDLDEEVITTPQNAILVLKSVEYEMERRYDMLAKAGVRHITDYNEKVSDPKRRPNDTETVKHHPIPYIVVIIDELADLMITSGKEVEEPIARIAQLARAVGIHLVVATQRPSVNVITGVIKANFPARIAYQVATRIDSRTILDMNGAETLLGRGDMLFLPGGMPKPIRIQNAFISTEEVERITNFIYIQKGFSKRYLLPSMFEKKKQGTSNFLSELDEMFEDAARVIVRSQQGSVSLLQRRLKLGYARAARIVDQLEDAGIVGPSIGSKARDVLLENEDQLDALLRSL